MSSPSPQPPASRLSQRLALILGALRQAAAARAAKAWSAAATVLLLWPYLHRLAARFEALAARLRAGSIAARPIRQPALRPRPARPPHLPQGFGWLLRLVPETVALRGQLQHLLADPEMAALLAAAPQAGRLLRPLCRMLGLSPGPDMPPALLRRHSAAASPLPAEPPCLPARGPRMEEDTAKMQACPAPA